MTKDKAEKVVKLINELISYKILDTNKQGDEGSTGYYLEIRSVEKELINELMND